MGLYDNLGKWGMIGGCSWFYTYIFQVVLDPDLLDRSIDLLQYRLYKCRSEVLWSALAAAVARSVRTTEEAWPPEP